MQTQINELSHKLSKEIIKVWIIKEIIEAIVGFLILGVLFYLDHRFEWFEWIGWILIIITILSLLYAIWSIALKPRILYRSWRYDLDEDYLQLKYGAITEENQLIPMTKIQAVSTIQGPFLKRYCLYSISIETMGSSHHIPGIPEHMAKDLRNQIAYYAKVKEVEK